MSYMETLYGLSFMSAAKLLDFEIRDFRRAGSHQQTVTQKKFWIDKTQSIEIFWKSSS